MLAIEGVDQKQLFVNSLKLYITVRNRGAKHHFTEVVARNLELPRDSLRPIKFLEKRRSN